MNTLSRLFAFDFWANQRVADLLAKEPERSERSVAILAHIVGAQWLWLRRLGREAEDLAIWPVLAPAEVPGHLERLRSAWDGVLGELDLEKSIEYRNSRGEAWTSRIDDVLGHVVLHGMHHRGQISALVREAGGTPPVLDYIEASRRGLLGPV